MGTNDKKQPGLFTPRSATPVRPIVMAGHLGVVVYEDMDVSWHVARMDLASRRMVFPNQGTFRFGLPGVLGLAETLNTASLQYIEQLNRMYD